MENQLEWKVASSAVLLLATSILTLRRGRISRFSFQSSSANLKKKHRRSREPIFSIAPTHFATDIHGMNRSFIRLPRGRIVDFLAWCFTLLGWRKRKSNCNRDFARSLLLNSLFCVTRFMISSNLFLWLIIIFSCKSYWWIYYVWEV